MSEEYNIPMKDIDENTKTPDLPMRTLKEADDISINTTIFKKEIGNDIKQAIKILLEKDIIINVKTYLRSMKSFRRAGNVGEILGKILSVLASLPAFLSPSIQEISKELSIVSGILSVLGGLFLGLASRLQKESSERSKIITHILRTNGINYNMYNITDDILDEEIKKIK